VKALVIGSGRMAAIRASALQELDDVQIVFATRDLARAQALAKEFGGAAAAVEAAVQDSPDMVFVTSATAHHRADLERSVPTLVAAAGRGAVTWVAYPKAKQLGTDLNRDLIRTVVQANGLDTVRQVALDDIWSALRLVSRIDR